MNLTNNEKLAALEKLIRKDHTPEESVHFTMEGDDVTHYCAGCGVDLEEEECPYLAILDAEEKKEDLRPHSRACGWRKHEHGTDCHSNCPTCGGKKL